MQFFKNYFFTIGFISISEWMTRFTTSFALQISFWRALYVDTAVMTCCRVVTDELVTLSSDRASSIASSKPLARPVGNCNLKNQIKFVSRLMSTRNKHLRQYILNISVVPILALVSAKAVGIGPSLKGMGWYHGQYQNNTVMLFTSKSFKIKEF